MGFSSISQDSTPTKGDNFYCFTNFSAYFSRTLVYSRHIPIYFHLSESGRDAHLNISWPWILRPFACELHNRSQNVTDLANLAKVTKWPRVRSLFKHVTFSANPCTVHWCLATSKFITILEFSTVRHQCSCLFIKFLPVVASLLVSKGLILLLIFPVLVIVLLQCLPSSSVQSYRVNIVKAL